MEVPPKRSLLGFTVIALIAASALTGVAFRAARSQVAAQLHTINPAASLDPSGVHPSRTFGIYLSFEIRGDSELRYAYWRLLPRPHVEFTK